MMAGRTRIEVVIGTDGSAAGRAAVDAAARFPWPARAGAVLVVASRGAIGVARLLLGSVAEGVMSRAPMSVLVVR
jgi:nucleotide-binding universal stress UspA family protein